MNVCTKVHENIGQLLSCKTCDAWLHLLEGDLTHEALPGN